MIRATIGIVGVYNALNDTRVAIQSALDAVDVAGNGSIQWRSTVGLNDA